jgi:hypothetical protein
MEFVLDSRGKLSFGETTNCPKKLIRTPISSSSSLQCLPAESFTKENGEQRRLVVESLAPFPHRACHCSIVDVAVVPTSTLM